MTRHRRKFRQANHRAGAVSVEFALVASVVFMLIFGCIEFSRMILLRNLAQDAAYEAARHCMVEGATTAEAIAAANDVLRPVGASGVTVLINRGQGITDTTEEIEVEITIPMGLNSILFKPFFRNRYINVGIALDRERYDGFYDSSSN